MNYEPTIDAISNDEHLRILLPLPMQLSNTINTTLQAITENALDDGRDFVGAMLDDVIAESGLGAASEGDQAPNYFLPLFRPVQKVDCTWGGLSGHAFSSLIDDAYSQIASSLEIKPLQGTLRINRKTVCDQDSMLFEAFTTESVLEAVALKAAMTLPALLLQKLHASPKYKNISHV